MGIEMARLAVARLWFCSNSFTARRTWTDDLQIHDWAAHAMCDARSQTALDPAIPDTELAGLADFLTTHPDWDVTMLRCASAPPGGPLSAEVFGTWLADVEEGLRRGRFEAVYLSLHGGCQAEGDPAADLTILRRVRTVIGHTPMVASFDVRANLSEEVAILLDGATCNAQWPSGGGAQAARRALALLEGILTRRFRPVGALARVPFVLPDMLVGDVVNTIANGTVRTMVAPVLEASVFAGFAWGDGPYTGPSALVWADRDAGAARDMAARLAVELCRARGRIMPDLVGPEASIAALAVRDADPRPILMLDLGDDPALGGLSDTSSVLLALLSQPIAGRAVLAALFDPEAVAEAHEAGLGGTVSRSLGARYTWLYGNAVAVDGVVQGLGDAGEAGRYAVLRVQDVDVLLTEERPGAITPAWLAARGVDIGAVAVVAVKGGTMLQAEFRDLTARTILCDCPGPTTPDLLRLRFHYVPAARRASGNDSRLASDQDSWAARGQRQSPPRPRLDQIGADQSYQRHEDRRAKAEQKRAKAFRA